MKTVNIESIVKGDIINVETSNYPKLMVTKSINTGGFVMLIMSPVGGVGFINAVQKVGTTVTKFN